MTVIGDEGTRCGMMVHSKGDLFYAAQIVDDMELIG